MKTLPSMIAAVLVVASFSASAYDYVDRETVTTGVVSSKSAAYEMGLSKLSSLQTSPSYELSREFGAGNVESDSFQVEDGFVTVQERADATGNIGYVGVVNVDVSYSYHESDD